MNPGRHAADSKGAAATTINARVARTLSRIEAGKGKPRYPDSAQRNSENWAPLQGAHPSATIWQHQVDMTDAKRRGDLEQRGYCWIATTSFKPT